MHGVEGKIASVTKLVKLTQNLSDERDREYGKQRKSLSDRVADLEMSEPERDARIDKQMRAVEMRFEELEKRQFALYEALEHDFAAERVRVNAEFRSVGELDAKVGQLKTYADNKLQLVWEEMGVKEERLAGLQAGIAQTNQGVENLRVSVHQQQEALAERIQAQTQAQADRTTRQMQSAADKMHARCDELAAEHARTVQEHETRVARRLADALDRQTSELGEAERRLSEAHAELAGDVRGAKAALSRNEAALRSELQRVEDETRSRADELERKASGTETRLDQFAESAAGDFQSLDTQLRQMSSTLRETSKALETERREANARVSGMEKALGKEIRERHEQAVALVQTRHEETSSRMNTQFSSLIAARDQWAAADKAHRELVARVNQFMDDYDAHMSTDVAEWRVSDQRLRRRVAECVEKINSVVVRVNQNQADTRETRRLIGESEKMLTRSLRDDRLRQEVAKSQPRSLEPHAFATTRLPGTSKPVLVSRTASLPLSGSQRSAAVEEMANRILSREEETKELVHTEMARHGGGEPIVKISLLGGVNDGSLPSESQTNRDVERLHERVAEQAAAAARSKPKATVDAESIARMNRTVKARQQQASGGPLSKAESRKAAGQLASQRKTALKVQTERKRKVLKETYKAFAAEVLVDDPTTALKPLPVSSLDDSVAVDDANATGADDVQRVESPTFEVASPRMASASQPLTPRSAMRTSPVATVTILSPSTRPSPSVNKQ